jgi:hypothetical protein
MPVLTAGVAPARASPPATASASSARRGARVSSRASVPDRAPRSSSSSSAETDELATTGVGGALARARSALASTAAAVVLATTTCHAPAALARVAPEPPAPTNGPLASLPRELTEPDDIFYEDFTVSFAGIEVDHKYLVSALILGQAVGFVGSVVGGNEARKKGEEVKALNQSLLKVNAELRKEMREAGIGPDVPIQTQRFIKKAPGSSTDEEEIQVDGVITTLKRGKRLLSAGDHEAALAEFDDALRAILGTPDVFQEEWKARRKAQRGRGAALERMGRFPEALAAMENVLALSVDHDDHAGQTDALGVIADIYTDMDLLEEAASYYDRYFTSLQEEDARVSLESAAVGGVGGSARM